MLPAISTARQCEKKYSPMKNHDQTLKQSCTRESAQRLAGKPTPLTVTTSLLSYPC